MSFLFLCAFYFLYHNSFLVKLVNKSSLGGWTSQKAAPPPHARIREPTTSIFSEESIYWYNYDFKLSKYKVRHFKHLNVSVEFLASAFTLWYQQQHYNRQQNKTDYYYRWCLFWNCDSRWFLLQPQSLHWEKQTKGQWYIAGVCLINTSSFYHSPWVLCSIFNLIHILNEERLKSCCWLHSAVHLQCNQAYLSHQFLALAICVNNRHHKNGRAWWKNLDIWYNYSENRYLKKHALITDYGLS